MRTTADRIKTLKNDLVSFTNAKLTVNLPRRALPSLKTMRKHFLFFTTVEDFILTFFKIRLSRSFETRV